MDPDPEKPQPGELGTPPGLCAGGTEEPSCLAWENSRQPHTEGPHSLNTLLGLRWGGLAAASAPSRPSSDSSDNGALDSSHVQSVGRELPSHKVSGAWRLLLPYRSLPTSFQQ